MSHVTFEHIKGTDNILAHSFSHLKSIYLYDPLDHEREGKEFGHDFLKNCTNKHRNPSTQKGKEFEKLPPIHTETPLR